MCKRRPKTRAMNPSCPAWLPLVWLPHRNRSCCTDDDSRPDGCLMMTILMVMLMIVLMILVNEAPMLDWPESRDSAAIQFGGNPAECEFVVNITQ